MIIKQYLDVIKGTKTQTRRMKDRYQVGKVYSVVPKMYQATVKYAWVSRDDVAIWHPTNPLPSVQEWTPLKIRITDKRQECLQDITEADAIAEGIIYDDYERKWFARFNGERILGFTPVDTYKNLWSVINLKVGTRWEDNPLVYVYTFELVA